MEKTNFSVFVYALSTGILKGMRPTAKPGQAAEVNMLICMLVRLKPFLRKGAFPTKLLSIQYLLCP